MMRALGVWVAAALVIGAGCSSSPAGSSDGGGSGGGGGAGGADGGVTCGDTSCATNQVCLRTQTLGGAQNCPGDGGTCPGGYELAGACCVMIPGWSCVARPGGCGASVTCACAMGTLCTSGRTCTMPRDDEIDCTLLAP
jgi:hypothetical protein